jgi:hypothetical protein
MVVFFLTVAHWTNVSLLHLTEECGTPKVNPPMQRFFQPPD